MARTGRGGKRTPREPAAVSGPGALSRRTDGQPVREIEAENHGDRKVNAELQAAAPMSAGASSPTGRPRPGAGPPPSLAQNGIFGPTARPNEPINAGLMTPGDPANNPHFGDPYLVLQAMYAAFPHPTIARMIQDVESSLS